MSRMAVPRSEGPQRAQGLPGMAPRDQPDNGKPPRTDATPPEEKTGFRHLLAQRDFQLIWYAQVAAQLADKFLMFSLIILAYRLSGGSTEVAITLLAYTLPAVAIAPLAGVVADRYNRKGIMVSTNLARAVLIALIPPSAL